MNTIKTVAMLAVLAGLSACATVEPPAVAQADGSTAALKVADSSSTITGTRIPSKKTSQPVQSTSGQDYDNAARNAPSPFSKN